MILEFIQNPSFKKVAMTCQRAGRSSWLGSALCSSHLFFLKALLFFGLATMQPLIALELKLFPSELDSLKSLLLEQLSAVESLRRGLGERTLTIDSLEKSLREQSALLSRSERQIDDLQDRLKSSNGLAASLQQELTETRRLSSELQTAHEALLRSFASFRAEAQLQIRALQSERDRERARASLWAIAGGVALAAATAILVVDLAGAR